MITDITGGNYVLSSRALTDVRKYTASSFYNWEQDNIPIEDLESRTDALALNTGQLSTSIEGVTMVLSSTADTDMSVYDNITDILDRIPKIITFPILVELCEYGDLGELKLEGITLKGNGALQFINRNYAASIQGNHATTSKTRGYTHYTGLTPYGDEAYVDEIDSRDLWNTISTKSSARNGASCFVSGTNGWNQNSLVFGTVHSSSEQPIREPFFFTSSTQPFIIAETSNTGNFTFKGLPYAWDRDQSVSGSDANPREFQDSLQQSFRATDYASSGAAADVVSPIYAYANHFTNVKIEDCRGGQIHLKGVCVDGVSATSLIDSAYGTHHASSIGFDIQNSDVILTSCASFRNRKAGFKIDNSNVTVEGGIVGYRNYPLNGTKTGNLATAERPSTGFYDRDLFDIDTSGHGFYATNSTVNFDSDSSLTNVSGTSNLGKHGYMMMSNGGNGWLFENCKVYGGVGGHTGDHEQGAGYEDYQTTQLISSFNKLNGFVFEDSNVKYQGIIRAQANEVDGVRATKSYLGAMGVMSECNQETGLNLDATKFVYNIGAQRYTAGYDQGDANAWEHRAGHSRTTPAMCVTDNGAYNIKVHNNSNFSDSKIAKSGEYAGLIGGRVYPTVTRAMQAANGKILSGATINEYEKGNLPLISVDNNSHARLLGLAAFNDIMKDGHADSSSVKASVKGRALQVTNNSTADLYGTSAYSTVISAAAFSDTAAELKVEWTKSGLYAGNNSRIRISGPTKITSHGVGALAEHFSKIEIGPALDDEGVYDESLNPNDKDGHTRVEIHSSRACLVANDKSTLEMIKCGTPASGFYTESSINQTSVQLADKSDGAHTNAFIQFYPQGFTEEAANNNGGAHGTSSAKLTNYRAMHSVPGAHARGSAGLDSSSSPDTTKQDEKSSGGMCVRAVGGSNVIVDQVNFQVKANAYDLSGAYYNIDGSGGEHIHGYAGRRFDSDGFVTVDGASGFFGSTSSHYGGSQILMWNIADNSRIVASNLRVNGANPSGCGFHGPAGRYGAASGLGDTLGPLDYYGKGGAYAFHNDNGNLAGSTGFTNTGPFRLLTGVCSDLMGYYEFIRESASSDTDLYTDQASGNVAAGRQAHQDLGGSPIAQLNAQGYAGAGTAASSVDGADDRRLHSMIEQQWYSAGAIEGLPPIVSKLDYNHYGQPIWGGYRNLDMDTNMYVASNTIFPNQMLDTATIGQHDNNAVPLASQVPLPPLHMEWQGYLRNFLDETAADTFANAKHSASKMVKQCSIFRSTTDPLRGGEGRDGTGDYSFGHGVRSLNLFDLDKLV